MPQKKDDEKFNAICPNDASGEDNLSGQSIFGRLEEYSSRAVPFHMPGHKRNPNFEYLCGIEKYDITEIEGFDNLNDARGVILESEKLAAEVFGVKRFKYLVNGSTCGILASVYAATRCGDKILIARSCHKSVYNAAEIRRLKTVYVVPGKTGNGFYGSLTPADVEKAFEKNPDIKCAIFTSPTYEGVLSDVRGIADVVHSHGAALIVDEAHGAHLGLNDGFEKSARTLGADIVINSFHKTLASLNQTAAISVCSDAIDADELDESIAVFQTSSPSYPLIASMDGAVRRAANPGTFDVWSKALDDFYTAADLNNLSIFRGEGESVFAFDKSKIIILTNGRLSGIELTRKLRLNFNIELETFGLNYAVAMTGAGDTGETLALLLKALKSIDREPDGAQNCVGFNGTANENIEKRLQSIALSPENKPYCGDCGFYDTLPEIMLYPFETRGLKRECVEIEKSIGRVSAEYVWAYPPGAPLLAPGEIVSKAAVEYLRFMHEAGINVCSSYKGFPDKLYVLKARAASV